MTPTRNRSAWIWLAVAALAVASVARAEAGIESATAFANPVLHFLAAHAPAGTSAAASAPRLLRQSSRQHDANPGAWMAMLPVFFIGLVAPLSLISPSSLLCLGRAPAGPALPCRFQRPPPALL